MATAWLARAMAGRPAGARLLLAVRSAGGAGPRPPRPGGIVVLGGAAQGRTRAARDEHSGGGGSATAARRHSRQHDEVIGWEKCLKGRGSHWESVFGVELRRGAAGGVRWHWGWSSMEKGAPAVGKWLIPAGSARE